MCSFEDKGHSIAACCVRYPGTTLTPLLQPWSLVKRHIEPQNKDWEDRTPSASGLHIAYIWICQCICKVKLGKQHTHCKGLCVWERRRNVCTVTFMSVYVLICMSFTHTHRCVALVSAAQCEPCRYAPPISPVSRHRTTKRPVAEPAGIDLLPCVLAQWGHTGGAHSSIPSTWLIRSSKLLLNETGPFPSFRTLNQPTQTTQRSGVHSHTSSCNCR